MECLRLRVKDIDLGYNQSVVRDGKGERDRITLLPATLKHSLAIDAARRILTVDTESQPAVAGCLDFVAARLFVQSRGSRKESVRSILYPALSATYFCRIWILHCSQPGSIEVQLQGRLSLAFTVSFQ
jgi:integrase